MSRLARMQNQTSYKIHPIDIPADTIYYEKPSRIPTFSIDVLGVAILCAVFAGMFCWAIGDIKTGVGGAGVVGFLVTVIRAAKMLGDPFPEIKETTFQRVRVDTEPGVRSVPVNHGNGQRTDVEMRNAKRLSANGREYTFEGWQLDRMLSWVEQGYESIRRDQSAEGPGLSQISITGSNYSIVAQLMKDEGIISDDNKWTTFGRDWLKAI